MSFSSFLPPVDAALEDGFDDAVLEAAGIANDGNEGFGAAGAAAGVEEPKEKPPNGFEGVEVRFTEANAPFPAVPGVDDLLACENLQLFRKTIHEKQLG